MKKAYKSVSAGTRVENDTNARDSQVCQLIAKHNVSGSWDEVIRAAADKWVFYENGNKWSNNDDTAGDNFNSFMAGANYVLQNLKLKNIKILTKQKCKECDGYGVVSSHIWNEFFEIESQSNETWEQEKVEEWFRERGYGQLPPEEPSCSECNGIGEIEKWIDIQEIIELANTFG